MIETIFTFPDLMDLNLEKVNAFLRMNISLTDKEITEKLNEIQDESLQIKFEKTGQPHTYFLMINGDKVGEATMIFGETEEKTRVLQTIQFFNTDRTKSFLYHEMTGNIPILENQRRKRFSYGVAKSGQTTEKESITVPNFGSLSNIYSLWKLLHEYGHAYSDENEGGTGFKNSTPHDKLVFFQVVQHLPNFFINSNDEEIYKTLGGSERKEAVAALRASAKDNHITMTLEDARIVIHEEMQASKFALQRIEDLFAFLKIDYEPYRATFCEYAALNLLAYTQFLNKIIGKTIVEYADMAYKEYQSQSI